MPDLITLPRAKQNGTLAALLAGNPSYLGSLISAASTAIERYCSRKFGSNTFTEYYSGPVYLRGRPSILLRQFPVTEILDISTANMCLQVLNSGNGGTVQKATIETLSTGDLQLISTASGVVTSNTIAIASNLTIQAVANAIAGLGNGWSTAIFGGSVGSYARFPSADLRPLQGAASCMVGGTYLEIFEQWYGWSSNTGYWPDGGGDFGSSSATWRLDAGPGEIYGQFPRGTMNLRIKYTAGEAVVPADVQEACVILVQQMYQQSLSNSALKEAKLGNSSYVLSDSREWPKNALMLLDSYKDYSKDVYRG